MPLVTAFGERLGRGNGTTCLRFRRFAALDRAALTDPVTEAVAAAGVQEAIDGRNGAVSVERP